MTEQKPNLGIKDFLNLPNGREEFARHTLDREKRELEPDTRHTDEESLELYRLKFDRIRLALRLSRKEIAVDEFIAQEDELNDKVSGINQASYQRRHPNS